MNTETLHLASKAIRLEYARSILRETEVRWRQATSDRVVIVDEPVTLLDRQRHVERLQQVAGFVNDQKPKLLLEGGIQHHANTASVVAVTLSALREDPLDKVEQLFFREAVEPLFIEGITSFARRFAALAPVAGWSVPWDGFGKGGGVSGRYSAMKVRTFSSVSGHTRRPPRSPRTNFQSLIAARPKALSATPVRERNDSTSAKRSD